MIVEILGENVKIIDGVATCQNKTIEDFANIAISMNEAPENGPLFALYEFFGDDVKIIKEDLKADLIH